MQQAITNITKKLNLRLTTEYAILIAYLLMVVLFSFLSPVFFTVRNFLNIGLYSSVMGVTAVGMSFALLSGSFDLSVSSVMALTGMVIAGTIPDNGSPIPAILLGISVGVVCGLVNSLLITKVKINPLIATLGTMSIIRGIAYLSTNGTSIMIKNSGFKVLGRGYILGIPVSVIIMIMFFIIGWVILTKTPFGRKVYSIGGNSTASYLAGINVSRIRFAIFVIVGITASVSGILVTAQTGAGIPQAAQGLELDIVAAVILGGTSLSGGKGSIVGTFFGVLILATLANGLVLMNVPSFWQMVAKGAALILAVVVDVLRGGGYERF